MKVVDCKRADEKDSALFTSAQIPYPAIICPIPGIVPNVVANVPELTLVINVATATGELV